MMQNLKQEQLSYLETLLNHREQALRVDIRREVNSKDDPTQVTGHAPDPGDPVFADISVDLGQAAVTRDLSELRAIESVRTQIKNGTYGECIECGYEIPFARLQALPTAQRCAPCQEMYEKSRADRGSLM